MRGAIIDAITAISINIWRFLGVTPWNSDLAHLSRCRDVENRFLMFGLNRLYPTRITIAFVVDLIPDLIEGIPQIAIFFHCRDIDHFISVEIMEFVGVE